MMRFPARGLLIFLEFPSENIPQTRLSEIKSLPIMAGVLLEREQVGRYNLEVINCLRDTR